MKQWQSLNVVILLNLLAAAACGRDESPRGDLDPNAPPTTEGTWYRPDAATTWQWQLSGAVNTGYAVTVYDIDLFESETSLIAELEAAGRKVICYFSAGSSEDWRDDYDAFLDTDMGEPLDGWEGERWLDVRSANVQELMLARLDVAVGKGCDGVEPDNVDGYANDSGFDLTATDQLAYNRFIANAARARGLAVGLKNDGDQAGDLVDYFDFSLNEQCHEYDECGALAVFPDRDEPVFNAEYAANGAAAQTAAATLCPRALVDRTRTLILPLDLDDSFRVSCD